MTLIVGITLMALAVAVFWWSLPRGGRTAVFVGTEWEPYAAVAMLGCLAGGLLLTVSGVTEVLN